MEAAANAVGLENDRDQFYVLRLYVTAASPNSIRAIANLKAICEKHLHGSYDLEIIDVHQQVEKASEEQLVALPLLVKKSPGMPRRLIGDMSDENKVLRGLGLSI